MNKILSNIRSVPGVWGTIAIDKKRALTYQLLPGHPHSKPCPELRASHGGGYVFRKR
jgi:hypothetical protein